MSDEERTSEHGGEDGTDNVPGEGHDIHTRYNFRTRVTTRAQERSHQTSPLYQTVMQGDLEAQSTELLANSRRTLADTARLLSTPRMTVADALDGGQHRRPEDTRQDAEEARQHGHGVPSPFELQPFRGWMSEGQRQASTRSSTARVLGDTASRSGVVVEKRISLPFHYDRRDIPYVPPRTRMTEVSTSTCEPTTRMTAREKAPIEPRGPPSSGLAGNLLPTWTEFHQRREQQLAEGRRAIEKIAEGVEYSSDEPDIHLDQRPTLDWGRDAGRLGPGSRTFESRRPPAPGSGATRRGPRGHEFDNAPLPVWARVQG